MLCRRWRRRSAVCRGRAGASDLDGDRKEHSDGAQEGFERDDGGLACLAGFWCSLLASETKTGAAAAKTYSTVLSMHLTG